MLLVSQLLVLEIGEEKEVGDDPEDEKHRIVHRLNSVVNDHQIGNGLEAIAYTGSESEHWHQLLGDGFHVANDRSLANAS
jgi:hypothetical protein